MTTAIQPYVPGSLVDVAGGLTAGPQKVAMALMEAAMIVVCDVSSSMSTEDAGDPDQGFLQSRHSAAQDALDKLQNNYPGQVAVAAFNELQSINIGLVPTGKLPSPEGGTPMFAALSDLYPKAIIGQKQFVIISDGVPTDDDGGCIELARQNKYPIYAIYVGPHADSEGGRDFMERLAAASGGKFDYIHTSKMYLLESKLAGYLTARVGQP